MNNTLILSREYLSDIGESPELSAVENSISIVAETGTGIIGIGRFAETGTLPI
jgi:hypothetical protein